MWLIDSKCQIPLTYTAYKSYTAGREWSKCTHNTMMFNIKIKDIKLLHSYPDNQLCKKQMLDVFTHIDTLTHSHTSEVHTEKQVIYSKKNGKYTAGKHTLTVRLICSKWVNYGTTTQPATCQSLYHLHELNNPYCHCHGNAEMAWTKRNNKKTLAYGTVGKIHFAEFWSKKRS